MSLIHSLLIFSTAKCLAQYIFRSNFRNKDYLGDPYYKILIVSCVYGKRLLTNISSDF